jgi:hypothetical protein
VLGNCFGEQIKRHAIVADHRLGHRLNRFRQFGQQAPAIDKNTFVIGSKMLGDDVGIVKFVAALAADILETDRIGAQMIDPRFSHQAADQAGIDPARE